jgi:hypothetical protein
MTTTPVPGHQAELSGWYYFAGILLGILGVLNVIWGIAAIGDSRFFVGDAKFILSDLNTWGWILIVIAAIQAVAAVGILVEWRGFRWVGVAIAGLNSIAQLLFMPAYPLWALTLFALDILVIYALVAYGAVDRS